MNKQIHNIDFNSEEEIIQALQIAGRIAESAGLGAKEILQITTAVSEIARNSFQYTGSGQIYFSLNFVDSDSYLSIKISDNGKGITDLENILKGNFTSKTGSGMGISSAGKLVDIFEITSHPDSGTEVKLFKKLADVDFSTRCEDWLCNFEKSSNLSLLNLLKKQNNSLIEAYEKLSKKENELQSKNEALQKTNTDLLHSISKNTSTHDQLVEKTLNQKELFSERLETSKNNTNVNWNVLQAIVDNTPILVYVKDIEGRYLLSNKKYNEVFKYKELEIIGKTDFDLVNEEKAARYHEIDQMVISEKKPFEREETIEYNGKNINLLVIKFPLFDQNNEVYGIGGIATNITERVMYREQLIEAKSKAENAEQVQELFLANMSHEIRTPMNGIIGMTNLILDTQLDDEQKDFVNIIKNSSDNLLVLINDILDISKIKAGKMNIENIDFSIRKTVENTLSSFRNKIQENGLKLRVAVDMSVPDNLIGDPYRLNQILTNLISNSIKFTSKGEINLEITLLNNNENGIELAFFIKDTGIGIETEKLNHIFENFSQAEEGTTRKFGGTGLGLSITKQLVELQGGTIDVSSNFGEGSTFKVVINYQLSKKDNKHTTTIIKQISVENDSLFGKRILIVEDNPTNQKVIFHILRKAGLEPDLADNGKEAIKLLESGFTYDLIIMDLQMPEMNGFDTTIYIRNVLKLDIPIIAMTASALRNERTKCLQVGMNEYLTKPFVPADLFKQLRIFLVNKPEEVNAIENEGQQIESKKPYNLNYLMEMEDLDFLQEVIKIFLDTTPGTVSEIRQALFEKNWITVYEKAHKLKSSLGILQLNKMLTIVSQIELDAKEERNISRIAENMDILENLFVEIIPMLENEIENAKQLLTKI